MQACAQIFIHLVIYKNIHSYKPILDIFQLYLKKRDAKEISANSKCQTTNKSSFQIQFTELKPIFSLYSIFPFQSIGKVHTYDTL